MPTGTNQEGARPAMIVEQIKCLWCDRTLAVHLNTSYQQQVRCFCGNVITVTPIV